MGKKYINNINSLLILFLSAFRNRVYVSYHIITDMLVVVFLYKKHSHKYISPRKKVLVVYPNAQYTRLTT